MALTYFRITQDCKDLTRLLFLYQQAFSVSETRILQMLANERYVFFGATALDTNDNALLGFAVFSTLLDEAELLHIAVDEAHQGKAIGQALLDYSLSSLSDSTTQTISTVLLEVRASNTTAIKLYQRAGFIQNGVRKDYYPATSSVNKEDALLYSKALNVI